MIVPRRYNGPPGSANGGYACGLLAGLLGGEAEVTLRVPPPLDRELAVVHLGERVELRDGETLVAEAERATVDRDVPPPVSVEDAAEASRRYAGFSHHAYPTCYTCGPERDDGLGIYAGPVEGREGLVASPWTPPADTGPETVWAALDCPGGWAVDDFQREGVLLGRMAARIDRLPEPGEPHVVVGWRVGAEGRKRYAGSALLTADGEAIAWSRSTWIVAGGAS
ncbi:MAG TPA: hypothetical protein VK915_13655 [Gaiellaceae bacterium]|nr:hypothetical protein [Gaiellaceae bacterium]